MGVAELEFGDIWGFLGLGGLAFGKLAALGVRGEG